MSIIYSLKLPSFSGRNITSEVSTTSTTYVTIVDSDILIDARIFKIYSKLYIRFFAQLKVSVYPSGLIAYAQLYRQHAGTAVAGTEVSVALSTDYNPVDSGWVDISNESGPESYQVQMKLNTLGTAYCNSAIMVICGMKLPNG